jgi:hypothetical protein
MLPKLKAPFSVAHSTARPGAPYQSPAPGGAFYQALMLPES